MLNLLEHVEDGGNMIKSCAKAKNSNLKQIWRLSPMNWTSDTSRASVAFSHVEFTLKKRFQILDQSPLLHKLLLFDQIHPFLPSTHFLPPAPLLSLSPTCVHVCVYFTYPLVGYPDRVLHQENGTPMKTQLG